MPRDFVDVPREDNRDFDQLLRDIEQGLRVLQQAIERIKKNGPDDETTYAEKRLDNTLKQIRKVPDRDDFQVNRFTAEFAKLQDEKRVAEKNWLLQSSSSLTKASTETIGKTQRTISQTDQDDPEALLFRSNMLLDESTTLIQDIDRTIAKTHQISNHTLQSVEEQQLDLNAIRSNVNKTGYSARNAGTILRRMAERAFYNRVFLWVIIAALFIANILFLWFGYIKKN